MCPHCGFEVPSSASYCARCGKSLKETKTEATAEERADRWGWTIDTPSPDHTPHARKPFLDRTGKLIIIVSVPLVIITLTYALYVDQTEKAKRATYLASLPTPTPFAPLAPADAISKAKSVIAMNDNATDTQLAEVTRHLQAVREVDKEYKQAQILLNQAEAMRAKRRVQEALRGPLPEMIGEKVWCVDRYLKYNLNDYDSSEYLQWTSPIKVIYEGEPYWAVRLRLRAANAFGGKIIKEPMFYIQQDKVVRVEGL
jgi:hypothetical protein